MKDKKDNKIEGQLLKILADQLGITTDDISHEDFLRDDLHMTARDLSDFGDILIEKELIQEELDFTEIETVNDLIENVASDELL
ncbi:hypothetical protein HY008_03350 [Candidatus Woesebacteria bacterium]|nr:hypothetical protein [Candidatus Woesebacteria bacterium]